MIDVAFVPGVQGFPPWAAQVLDAGELARWDALRDHGRPPFLAAHAGVRALAARRLAWSRDPRAAAPDLDAFSWATLPTGKPRLTFRDGRPVPVHVSVSHAAGMALVAVSDHGPLGVDVEHVVPTRNFVGIARRFFSPEEHASLCACDGDQRTLRFHQWWTRKEAVLKATGAGLRGGLSVRVDGEPDRDGWRRVLLTGHPLPLFVRDLRTPDPSVAAAVAVEGEPGVVQSVHLTLDAAPGFG